MSSSDSRVAKPELMPKIVPGLRAFLRGAGGCADSGPWQVRLGRAWFGPDHRNRLPFCGLISKLFQRVSHGLGIPGSVGGCLGHQFDHQFIQLLGQHLDLVAGTGGRFVEMAVHQHHGRGALERGFAGQHLVEEDPERVEIGLVADGRRAAYLLGSHISRRAEGPPRSGQLGGSLQILGDAEIGELELAVGGDHQVRRLEVPMDHVHVMGVLKCVAKLDREIDGLAPGKLAAILKQTLQGHALDIFHREIGRAFESSPGQPPDDVGMPELLEDLCFAFESVEDLALLGKLAVDDLHGGRSAGRLLGCPEDDAHRARAQDFFKAEGT